MILTGKEIDRQIWLGNIKITNFDDIRLNPNSYDVTLNEKLLIYSSAILDMKKNNPVKELIIPEDGMILYPNELYLGRTNEKTITNKFVPMLDGKSSIGRLGLGVEISAGFGDVGFNGYWTLEITVIKPVKIYPNVPIAQVFFEEVKGDVTLYTNGKYQNNEDVQPSMMWKNF